MKRLEDRDAAQMQKRSRDGRCAECGEDLGGGGTYASVPGYPPNLLFGEVCLADIGHALLAAEHR